jgi:acyl-CoA thioesterase FadM
MIYQHKFTTAYSDLDWNRHVTSRTYEKMAYSSRMEILKELGYPISTLLQKNYKWVNKRSKVKFHSQQFENSELKVETEVYKNDRGSLHFHQRILDTNNKLVCSIGNESILLDETEKIIILDEIETTDKTELLFEWNLVDKKLVQTLNHKMYIPFNDMSCFWNLPSDSIWKIFEEGRFMFFHEVIDLDSVSKTDTTTFFMGGEIEIIELPKPGSKVLLETWIESFQKIRFYFRQDILSENGDVLVKMQDEQLFVSLSNSRPRKAPEEFLNSVDKYIKQ